MKSAILSIAIFCCQINASGQNINNELKKELEEILATDQGIREFIVGSPTEARKDTLVQILKLPKDSIETNPWGTMNKIDQQNLSKITAIVKKYGYPGKSMVGEPANTATFFVIQHAPKEIKKYMPLIEKAAKEKELPFMYYAMMLDRELAVEGKEQIYGTQIFSKQLKDSSTGLTRTFTYVVPIKDAANVNRRRKDAGFKQTVEENAVRLGITYKPYTYDELNKILSSK